MDLASNLTQVLNDGATTYTYGVDRIAQTTGADSEYFLGDALGSVRQLTDANGVVSLDRNYDPFGEVEASVGSGSSMFGFTGEQQDSTGMVFLRARYYGPYLNQFIQPDTIVPDPRIPADWNKYTYTRDNPINYVDPSGRITVTEATPADGLISQLFIDTNVLIVKDWGYQYYGVPRGGVGGCMWQKGNWDSYNELVSVRDAVNDMVHFMGNSDKFKKAMNNYPVHLIRHQKLGNDAGLTPILPGIFGDFILFDNFSKSTVVHELAHVWDARHGHSLSEGMMYATGSYRSNCSTYVNQIYCSVTYNVHSSSEAAPSDYVYSSNNAMEDWAESFMGSVYPSPKVNVGPIRKKFVSDAISNIPDTDFWR